MASVTVRYWAGARAAAGIHEEPYEGDTLGAVLDAAASAHGAELARVFSVATFLLDGSRSARDAPLTDGVTIEVLPPFAGGSR